MCGIAGIIGIKNQNKSEALISQMTDRIAHRGPDSGGHFLFEEGALGHRRLAIIDLNPESNQPFKDHSGRYTMVFNGEIYNFKEIKAELINDYPFKTKSDTEVVLASYIKWGPKSLSRLNGMFALAIWDNLKKELFVARDRVGIKPLYYYSKDGLMMFSSEIRALIATDLIPKQLNKEVIADYLNYQAIYAPNSIIENVFQLQSGYYGIWNGIAFETKKYWDIADLPKYNFDFQNEIAVKHEIKRLLLTSIEKRMISDVPLGAFLSGGIDSSAVVALMAELSENPINTFSIIFDETKFDESTYSELIANKYKTNHHPILLQPKRFLEELPQALAAMDSPTGDGPNAYLVSKVTRNAGITVALSGLGGDELFAGYPVFKQIKWLEKYRSIWRLPKAIRNLGGYFVGMKNGKGERLKELLSKDTFAFEEIYPTFRKLSSESALKKITQGIPIHNNSVTSLLSEKKSMLEGLPLLSQITAGELMGYTQNVLLKDTDQMSMASALEVRVPFFDHELIEFVMQIPDKFKYPKYAKSLLVESIASKLPNEIVHRQKMGFVLPWEQWMRNELKNFCEERIIKISTRSIFNETAILNLWSSFLRKDKQTSWMNIWLLVVLEEWLSSNGID